MFLLPNLMGPPRFSKATKITNRLFLSKNNLGLDHLEENFLFYFWISWIFWGTWKGICKIKIIWKDTLTLKIPERRHTMRRFDDISTFSSFCTSFMHSQIFTKRKQQSFDFIGDFFSSFVGTHVLHFLIFEEAFIVAEHVSLLTMNHVASLLLLFFIDVFFCPLQFPWSSWASPRSSSASRPSVESK